MASFLPKSIQDVINGFSRLPGIGPKTASRLAFYLLKNARGDGERLGDALLKLKKDIVLCPNCFQLTTNIPCEICRDVYRDEGFICVVADPLDVVALEKTHEFKGVYHILHGVISPIDGIGPDNLRIKELIDRVKNLGENMNEVILATNPSLEGDATAGYIADQLKLLGVKTTRIARGIPVGGELEYADERTLGRAIKGRSEY